MDAETQEGTGCRVWKRQKLELVVSEKRKRGFFNEEEGKTFFVHLAKRNPNEQMASVIAKADSVS